MGEPVEYRSELNEGEKRCGEFVVARADAPVAFDAAEEVFDAMATTVIPAMEGDACATRSLRRDADTGPLPPEASAEHICVEAFVGDRTMSSETRQERFHRVQIVPLAGSRAKRHSASVAIDDGCKLRIDPAFGTTNCLRRLAARRIRAVLVQLDVRAVDVA